MTPKAEKLLPKIEKAGIKASLKAGRVVTREELLEVKVQLMPTLLRWTFGGGAAAAAYGSYVQWIQGGTDASIGFALLALVLLFFAWMGVRKTLGKIVDGMDAASSAEIIGHALRAIVDVTVELLGGLGDLG